MKSMLHEASSVIKAIEKAWIESGKPSEFTIKILEEGQKSFLGLTKRPAIVSITFAFEKPVEKGRFKERDFQVRKRYEQQPQQARQPERPRGQPQRVETQRADAQDFLRRQQAVKKAEPYKVEPQIPEEIWLPEWVTFVTENLKELLKATQIQIGFNTRMDKKNLFISFEKPIMEEAEENRIFFNATSYLLMQFLKRKHKKKFRGYQILMSSTVSNEPTNSGK